MADWPASLPPPLVNGAGYTPQENTIRTQMVAGAAKMRRRFTAVPEMFAFTLRLTRAQVDTLDAFVVGTLKDVLPFDWQNFRRPPATQPPVQLPASTSTTGGTGLAASTTYFYVITAIGPSGESLRSNERSVTTGTGTTNSNTLSWEAVNGATGYRIYRGTAAGAQNVYYAVGAVTGFTDTGAASAAGSPPVIATDMASYRFVQRPAYTAAPGRRDMWDAQIQLERLP